MARKEKKYHFIYKTTNLLSGKYYIGMHSTDNLNDGYMGSGRRLRHSINKYGKQNHKVEILEFFENRSELIQREKEIITLNEIAKEECMNLMSGGTGGFISDEQQKNRSLAANKALNEKMKNDSQFYNYWKSNMIVGLKSAYATGKKNKNWGNKNKGGTLTQEHKDKIGKANSIKQKGEKNSQFGTKWAWVNKEGIIKKIKFDELKKYISTGWLKGRKK
jgi:hypothetical protein